MAGPQMRRAGLKEKYKRVIKVYKNDPDITPQQLRERFGKIPGVKLAELKKQALASINPDPPEHCPECGTHTGGGRCGFCEDLRQKELQT